MDIAKNWKNIIDTLQDGILVVDTGGTIRATNPSAEKLTGYTREELMGSSCRILNCTGCKIIGKGMGKEWCKLFSVGQSKLKQCTIKNKHNLSVHILKVASVLEDTDGKVIGAVEVLTDRTALVEKQAEIDALKNILHIGTGFSGILGKTPVMEALFQLMQRVAQTDAPVLIQGESGTGKELVALGLHENSPRRKKPFIKVNCAALNENLLESELFGHVKGAFTGADKDRIGRFEAANEGTLFLDEIGDIPMSTQVKLLRVLEEREVERVGDHTPFPVDIRIISATNRDLESMVEKGQFRKDLFFRINVFPLHIPSLRERKEDIPLMARGFVQQQSAEDSQRIQGFSTDAMDIFMAYDWPGNVRELRNAIEYAGVLCSGGWIESRHIPPHIRRVTDPTCSPGPEIFREPDSERDKLISQLKETRGNQSELARRLGISRVTLWKRIKKHRIRIPEDI
jgi:two-component system response regulator HydG